MQPPSTILIVDDQVSAREILRELLAEQGHNLAFAGSGKEAWAKAAELIPDLILLDVMMPDIDGFEVCSRLRADPHLAEVPIIMVTALNDHYARMQGIEAGADDFITKPFDLMELEARVRTITRLNRYRRLLMERTRRQQAESEVHHLKEAERIRSQHQEREKQAALDRLRHTFLSAVNHEMRTPLALIFQTIEMLEDTQMGELAPQQLDALTVMRRQSEILGKMVKSLTRVAAFLSKQKTVRPVWAQLEPVLNNVIPLAEFRARSKEITVETEIASNLPSFPLDVKQMEEALTQLVDNAIKFNRPGGKIKISAQADDDWVIIAVSDTGIGIEPEQMNRIWEVLEQKADPVRRAQEGLGLGLVLARYIVEAHRGTIEVESTPGQGSTFSVKLPRTKAKRARESSL